VPHFWPVLPEVGFLHSQEDPIDRHWTLEIASETAGLSDSEALRRLRNIADPKYKTAAMIVSDFSPNHKDADSRSPPINDPKRFDPNALPRNPARAKLETKITPAKNTGVHKAKVDRTARTAHDSKNNFCIGTKYITASVKNSPPYATESWIRGIAP
jgi:hypothetical protein